jgi:hypothetical protein
MRKLVLIAAFVLVSATAQAAGARGLSLAANDEPAATEQPRPVETARPVEAAKPVETPRYVDRPAAVTATPEAPGAVQVKPITDNGPQTPKVEKPKRKRESTEARVIYELHRHGIYW